MGLGIGLGLTTQSIGEVIAQIITGTAPVLGLAYDGDTVADVVTFANDYVTTATGPVTIASQEMNINSAGWVAYVGATALAEGDTVQVRQNTSDASGNLRTFTSGQVTVLAALTAPTVSTAATFAGTPQVGSLLTGTPATFAGNPVPTVVNEFLMDGVVVATGTTYTPVTGDIDAVPTFRSTATNSQGSIASTSAGGAAVLPALEAPAVATAATFSGTPQVGVLLTGTPATFTGYPVPTVVNTWLMDGVTVATADTYTPVTGDLGAFPIFRSTATNTEGSAVSNSAAGAAVLEASPTTPALFDSVNADGWRATYPTPPTFDPVGSPENFSVTSLGYDDTGTATTVVRTLTNMALTRQPDPNELLSTTDQVALSEKVYASDVVEGATNNSALDYPLPTAMWLTPDLERTTTSTFTARLAVSHLFGRSGKPVAAVKFIATDGTNTVEQTVSTMSSRQWGSGLYTSHFEASIDTTTLNAATICTLDAIIYPWVGDAFQISVDADTYPSPNLTVLKFLNDRTGSYGQAYAYVDPGAGGGAAVSSNPVTAATTPYTTVALAAAAIKVFNNANYGRNEASGGTIRLVAGTHTHASFAACSADTFPITIEAADVANKATTFFEDSGGNIFSGFPKKTKIKDIVVRKTGNFVFFSTGATLANNSPALTMENVSVDFSASADHYFWMLDIGRVYMVDVDCSDAASVFFSNTGNEPKMIHMIGSDAPLGGSAGTQNGIYFAAASRMKYLSEASVKTNCPAGVGQLFFNCEVVGSDAAIGGSLATLGPRGFHVVGCVGENINATNPVMEFWAQTAACENVLFDAVTLEGSRTLAFYNEITGNAKLGYLKNSVVREWNVKGDVFASQPYTGNWAVLYHVSFQSNAFLSGDSNLDAVGAGAQLGEILNFGEETGTNASPIATDWVDDRSTYGTAAGGGDYTPGPSNALPTVIDYSYPIDMKGRTISGTSVVGALQPV